MPRNNTTGVFTRVSNSFSEPISGTVIDPTDAIEYYTDIDDGLTFDDGQPLILIGSTSGVTTIKAADAASGTITLPAGTTDFSATGGTGQFVKQASAGAPFTVAQVSAAELTGRLPFANLTQLAAYSLFGNTTVALADGAAFTIGGLTRKASPAPTDILLLQDQAASGALKYSFVADVAAGGTVASVNAMTGAVVLSAQGTIFNLGISATVAANALTVAIKDASGANPSASSPVVISYRNATVATGTPSTLSVTAAASIVVSSGSTLGTVNNTPFHLLVVGFNDSGTFRMGIVNSSASGVIYPVVANGIASSTAEGGAGAADSAGVFYTGTAVTSKPYVVLARLTWGANPNPTAGTWVNAPDSIELVNADFKYPGEVVQSATTSTGSYVAAGTTVVPRDSTIPQQSETNAVLTRAITPTSHANWLDVYALANAEYTTASWIIAALFRDSTGDALAVSASYITGASTGQAVAVNATVLANSVAATTLRLNGAGVNAGTFMVNGDSGTAFFGGAQLTYITVAEIQG